ncbi:MAG: hypothetical protein Q9173_004293 [Seirophora scorigena]
MSRAALPLRPFLLFALLIHQSASAALTGTYHIQSNGVICSPDFGAPLHEDCNRALVELTTRKDNDAQTWFASIFDYSMKEEHETLPVPASNGTCVIDLDISPGARNRVAWSTLISIAQSVFSTCTSPIMFQGGWGAYVPSSLIMPRPVTKASSVQSDAKRNHIADIAIVISSPSSPFRSAAETDTELTNPVLDSSDSTAATSGSEKELAFFKGSFWTGALVAINSPL